MLILKFLNLYFQNGRHFCHFLRYVNLKITLNEQNHIRNNLVKTNSQYLFSLRRYGSHFFILKLRLNRWHSTGAECDKEPFGENRFFKYLFVYEII